MRILFSLLLSLLIAGCNFSDETDFAGDYLIDKAVLARNLDPSDNYGMLRLKPDGFFALLRHGGSVARKGTWEVLKSGYAPDSGNNPELYAILKFHHRGTSTSAELRGNIIYFTNPEGEPFNSYKSVLFIKSSL